MDAPETKEWEHSCEEAIMQVLRQWQALSYAVHHQPGGVTEFEEKLKAFAEDLVYNLAQRLQDDADDVPFFTGDEIAEFLGWAVGDDFGMELEDGSEFRIAELVLKVYKRFSSPYISILKKTVTQTSKPQTSSVNVSAVPARKVTAGLSFAAALGGKTTAVRSLPESTPQLSWPSVSEAANRNRATAKPTTKVASTAVSAGQFDDATDEDDDDVVASTAVSAGQFDDASDEDDDDVDPTTTSPTREVKKRTNRATARDIAKSLFTTAPREQMVAHPEGESMADDGHSGGEDEDDGYFDMDDVRGNIARAYTAFKESGGMAHTRPDYRPRLAEQAQAKLSRANITVHGLTPRTTSQRVEGQLKKFSKKEAKAKSRHTGRDDRATSEQVMDPRTRMILFKLINGSLIQALHGCVSTGKEANVYHATSSGPDLAVKVFKTSILVFKDRDRYVSGEHRYRNGYCKKNPRKMVQMWAEKELRNLKRMHASGIKCPEPKVLRQHVLVMDFIGTDGWPAPRLKDAAPGLKGALLWKSYLQCISVMRKLFHVCGLVHADLSEYNLLWHKKTLFTIDVSQSVEKDHPRALDFLRMDCKNVTDFFGRCKIQLPMLSVQQLYEFVVSDISDLAPIIIGDDYPVDWYSDSVEDSASKAANQVVSYSAALKAFVSTAQDRRLQEEKRAEADKGGGLAKLQATRAVEAGVFMQVHIPRSLNEMVHADKVFAAQQHRALDTTTNTITTSTTTTNTNTSTNTITTSTTTTNTTNNTITITTNTDAPGPAPSTHPGGEYSEGFNNEGDDPEGEHPGGDDSGGEHPGGEHPGGVIEAPDPTFSKKNADKAARKRHKQLVKAMRKEKLKTKVKKSVKKRQKKMAKSARR